MANRFWVFITGVLASALFGIILIQAFKETGGVNSYAMLAQAFLDGTVNINALDMCFDGDCVKYMGDSFIIFPPFPAILAMPFVAIFGIDFSGFIFLSLVLLLLSGFVWWKILAKFNTSRQLAFLFVIAIMLSSPLFYITIRGDKVWFFAHNVSFLSLSLALYLALNQTKAFLVGVLIGMSFLSRQMTMLMAPFAYALLIEDGLPLFTINKDRVKKFLLMALPIAVAIVIYLAYNYVRFDDMMETGYRFLLPGREADALFFAQRIDDIGIFHQDFFLFNFFYLFFQGFHVEFVGKYLTELGTMDNFGTSFLAASPFMFFLALTPIFNRKKNDVVGINYNGSDGEKVHKAFSLRVILIGVLVILIYTFVLMFYHSNGYSQYNAQRYVLDWLPIGLLFMATGLRKNLIPLFAVMVCYGLVLNLATIFVLFLST